MQIGLLSLAALAGLVGLAGLLWFMGRGMGTRSSSERRVAELLRAERLRMGPEFDRIQRERTDPSARSREVGS